MFEGLATGIIGSLIANIIYDVAKGINRMLNDPLIKALEDTSVYFSGKGIEFRYDKLRAILEGNDPDIERLRSGDTFINTEEFADQFISWCEFHLGNKSQALQKAKEIVGYFIKCFEYRALTNPLTADLLVKNYITTYGQLSHFEHSQIITNQQQILDSLEEKDSKTSAVMEQKLLPKIDNILSLLKLSDFSDELVTEYNEEIDDARELMEQHKPKSALGHLEKLKRRVWNKTTDNIVRFRILTNIGSAYHELNEINKAGQCFIEAKKYNPEDEKALCNCALGYFLLGNREKCQEMLQSVLSRNSDNIQAYSLCIETALREKSFEDIVESIPKEFRHNALIAASLGTIAAERYGVLQEAEKWLRISIESDKDSKYVFFTRAILGNVLFMLFLTKQQNELYWGNIRYSPETETLEEIEKLLTESWDKIFGTEIETFHLWIPANRALVRSLIGLKDKANRDIDYVLDVPNLNIQFKRIGAILFLREGNYKRAIQLLQEIQSTDKLPDTSYYLSIALNQEGKKEEARLILEDFFNNDVPEMLKIDACDKLVDIYLDLGQYNQARGFADQLYSDDQTNPFYLAIQAKIARSEDKIDEAIRFLDEAKSNISDITPVNCRRVIADQLCLIDKFEDAIYVFATFVNTTADSPDLHNYLLCLHRIGDLMPALEICKKIRESIGPLNYVTHMEIAIYKEIYDFDMAKSVCQEFLLQFPDDLDMRLNLASIDYHNREYDQVDYFLKEFTDIESLSLHNCIQIASLNLERGNYLKSLDIMYEARKKYFNELDAHLAYTGLLPRVKNHIGKLANAEKVSVDTAILASEEGQEPLWYLIEDRKNADVAKREYPPSHPFAKKLLGKQVGDLIILSEGTISPIQIEVKAIVSKYDYAWYDSLESSQHISPGFQGIQKVHIGEPSIDGGIPPGFQKLIDWESNHYEYRQKIETLYREGRLTIGGLAENLDADIIRFCFELMTRPDLGIHCALGTQQERDSALIALNAKPRLVLDLVALLTVYSLGIGNLIVSEYGKFGIVASTIETIKYIIATNEISLGMFDSNDSRESKYALDVKNHLEFLQDLLEWISGNCDELPCYKALTMKRDDRRKLEKWLGRSFSDSLLIALEDGKVLFSDDQRLRSFAKTEYNTDGVWTQALLMKCFNNGVLVKEKYNEYAIKLACSRYYQTSVDSDILLEAARHSDWQPYGQFEVIVNILGGEHSDLDSAINVAVDFIDKLWHTPPLPDKFLFKLLDSLVFARKRLETLALLSQVIVNKFGSESMLTKYVQEAIRQWESKHVMY